MNSIRKLKENVANFMTEIAAHYGIPKSEVVAILREINFYCLYQTLCREAMPVFTFRASGDKEGQQSFCGEKLFPAAPSTFIVFLTMEQKMSIWQMFILWRYGCGMI